MRKIAVLVLLLNALLISGCGANDRNDDIQKSENVITNGSGELNENNKVDNVLYTSDSKDNFIKYEINGDMLNVTGEFFGETSNYVLLQYEGEPSEEQVSAPVVNGHFSISRTLPDNSVIVNLFAGKEEYGHYDSIIIDFVKIENRNQKWKFATSPILESNKDVFDNKRENLNEYIVDTQYIQANNPEIIQLSNNITSGISEDYRKVLAIHDWVAENIYYDYEAFYSGNYQNADALNVLYSKRAVCEGYANLFAALTRAQDIPCIVRSGYALGVGIEKFWSNNAIKTSESNHAWNEAYVNGRWLIIDATWDSQNKIENGNMIKGENINHVYFDSNMEFFSLSHKIIE